MTYSVSSLSSAVSGHIPGMYGMMGYTVQSVQVVCQDQDMRSHMPCGPAPLKTPWRNFTFDFELNFAYCLFRNFFLLSRFLCLPQFVTLSLCRAQHDSPPLFQFLCFIQSRQLTQQKGLSPLRHPFYSWSSGFHKLQVLHGPVGTDAEPCALQLQLYLRCLNPVGTVRACFLLRVGLLLQLLLENKVSASVRQRQSVGMVQITPLPS